ncbi:MAG: phosphotransferase [Verrucomicrobia bacterium]|nr:phosphotransferase [Verrucomicrobiota bacterium]
MTSSGYRENPPGGLFLDPSDPVGLETHLRRHSVIVGGERLLSLARAGDGNMNCVVRASTSTRSLIVKQSRPWVEKYPQFTAPADRACREIEFYRQVAGVPGVADRMPRLIFADPEARLLVLEDLGPGGDYSGIYRGDLFRETEMEHLADFLTRLHSLERSEGLPAGFLANREMRALNHAHIYEIPLQRENGLDLDGIEPGLGLLARELQEDRDLLATVHRIGREAYLADGPCLLHGDFFPGSIVRTAGGPKVIDPEFAHYGYREYDLAILIAHLSLGRQPAHLAPVLLARYRPPSPLDLQLLRQLAGVEILRRILGYAQLPQDWTPGTRAELLGMARRWILTGRE